MSFKRQRNLRSERLDNDAVIEPVKRRRELTEVLLAVC